MHYAIEWLEYDIKIVKRVILLYNICTIYCRTVVLLNIVYYIYIYNVIIRYCYIAYTIRRTICNLRHTTYDLYRTAYGILLTTCDIRHTTYDICRTAYNLRRTVYNVRRAVYVVQCTLCVFTAEVEPWISKILCRSPQLNIDLYMCTLLQLLLQLLLHLLLQLL